MNRREIRDSAFKLLYEKVLRDDDIDGLYSVAEETGDIAVNDKVKELVNGTLSHWEESDEMIKKYSPKRDISRIAKINLVILKLAHFEMLYDNETPVNAAISEAVFLTQHYAYQEDTSFVNGILGAFSRDISDTIVKGSIL